MPKPAADLDRGDHERDRARRPRTGRRTPRCRAGTSPCRGSGAATGSSSGGSPWLTVWQERPRSSTQPTSASSGSSWPRVRAAGSAAHRSAAQGAVPGRQRGAVDLALDRLGRGHRCGGGERPPRAGRSSATSTRRARPDGAPVDRGARGRSAPPAPSASCGRGSTAGPRSSSTPTRGADADLAGVRGRWDGERVRLLVTAGPTSRADVRPRSGTGGVAAAVVRGGRARAEPSGLYEAMLGRRRARRPARDRRAHAGRSSTAAPRPTTSGQPAQAAAAARRIDRGAERRPWPTGAGVSDVRGRAPARSWPGRSTGRCSGPEPRWPRTSRSPA